VQRAEAPVKEIVRRAPKLEGAPTAFRI